MYRSSLDAREPQIPTKSEDYQGHLQGVRRGSGGGLVPDGAMRLCISSSSIGSKKDLLPKKENQLAKWVSQLVSSLDAYPAMCLPAVHELNLPVRGGRVGVGR
eukprot:1008147-Prorocentrum_minimum.AAC.1